MSQLRPDRTSAPAMSSGLIIPNPFVRVLYIKQLFDMVVIRPLPVKHHVAAHAGFRSAYVSLKFCCARNTLSAGDDEDNARGRIDLLATSMC